MSTDIYDGFEYMNSKEYKEMLQKKSDTFVPPGSKQTKTNNKRISPIAVKPLKTINKTQLVQSRKANVSPSTMTAMYGIRGTTSPIAIYDHDLDRPFSPIQVMTNLGLGDKSTSGFKSIARKPAPMEPSTTPNKGSPLTYTSYQRSLATDKNNDDDDWGNFDYDFHGGKKRTRKARSLRRKRNRKARSTRRKRTKKSYSRRYRGRKSR